MINELKIVVASSVVALFTACGGAPIQSSSVGLQENTKVVVIAEDLIGASVLIGSKGFSVEEDDLTPYQMGVFGAADKAIESMDILSLPVSPGDVNLRISKGGAVLYDKTLYVSKGQTREINL